MLAVYKATRSCRTHWWHVFERSSWRLHHREHIAWKWRTLSSCSSDKPAERSTTWGRFVFEVKSAQTDNAGYQGYRFL